MVVIANARGRGKSRRGGGAGAGAVPKSHLEKPRRGLDAKREQEAGVRGDRGKSEDDASADDKQAEARGHVLHARLVPVARVEERELDLEEDREDRLEHARHLAGW